MLQSYLEAPHGTPPSHCTFIGVIESHNIGTTCRVDFGSLAGLAGDPCVLRSVQSGTTQVNKLAPA